MDEIRISATMYCEYISCKHKNYVFLKNFKFLLLSSPSSQLGKKGLTNSKKLGTLLILTLCHSDMGGCESQPGTSGH